MIVKTMFVIVTAVIWLTVANAFNPPPFVDVGSCIEFAVVAGATITNDGYSILNGDLALSPGSAVVGFPPGEVVGTIHVTDSAAASCMGDLETAITDANSRPADATMSGELSGMTLAPGVYKSDGGFAITNILYLDGQNDPEAAWIFLMATTLTVNTGASVVMLNYDYENTTGINVWWSVSERADIFANAAMQGTVMAHQSIAVQTGASTGPLMANIGEVTLLTNVVNSYPFVLNVTIPITPEPTAQPTMVPTINPTAIPTKTPSSKPTVIPTVSPTIAPSAHPTMVPTKKPSSAPTARPSAPSATPTFAPTDSPNAETNSLSDGAIAGIVIGSVVFAAGIVAAVWFLVLSPVAGITTATTSTAPTAAAGVGMSPV